MSRPPRPSTYSDLVDDLCQQLKATVTTYAREWEALWPPRTGEPVAYQGGSPSDPTATTAGVESQRSEDCGDAYTDKGYRRMNNRLTEGHLRRAASKARWLTRQADELKQILTVGYDPKTKTYASQTTRAARDPKAITQRELDAQIERKERREAS